MCLTFFCINPHTNPSINFIMSFNRQEQTKRPTLAFHHYTQDPNIYGGRDPISTGTWLGLNVKTGVLVFLTNYDMEVFRNGKSRGQLVLKILSTDFLINQNQENRQQTIINLLASVLEERNKYCAFNLGVYDIKQQSLYYICSELDMKEPHNLDHNKVHGLCNSDLYTIWPKTHHGRDIFVKTVGKLAQLSKDQTFDEIHQLCKDKKRFSQKDDDQSSIFVEPYWCEAEKAQRMTKSTFMCVITRKEGYKVLDLKEVTYGHDLSQKEVKMSFEIADEC